MKVFDLLSQEDREKIIYYVDHYGFLNTSNSQGRCNLDEWDTNKSQMLIDLFGGQLIIKRPYTYSISANGIAITLSRAIGERSKSEPYWRFYNTFYKDVIPKLPANLYPIHGQQRYSTRLDCEITTCLTSEWLAENIWKGDEYKLNFPSGHFLKICKGMKLMKLLHKLSEEYGVDEQTFEDFRNWHSTFLNQKYLDGELCLSIHPLDYMTMSDNDNGWTSCMRWGISSDWEDEHNPGDYRAGTVECMNSPYAIVAYLHSPNKTMDIGGGYQWNNKKWRELFIIHDDIISEIKGYPYQDENLTNTVLMWIKELARDNLNLDFDDDEINVNENNKTDLTDKITLNFSFETGKYMYNDVGTLQKHRARINKESLLDRLIHNDVYDNYYTDDRKNNIRNYTVCVPYGGMATCVCCGAWLSDDESSTVVCHDCEPGYYCVCCGDYIYDTRSMVWISDYDSPICESCYEKECAPDDLTEETHAFHNMETLRWMLGYDSTGRPIYYGRYLNVYDFNCDAYDAIFNHGPHWESKYHSYVNYITLNDVKDMEAFNDLFGIWKDEEINQIYSDYGVVTPITEEEPSEDITF